MAGGRGTEENSSGLSGLWETLEVVSEFKYLGRVITVSDDDWTAVVVNLREAKSRRERMSSILGR